MNHPAPLHPLGRRPCFVDRHVQPARGGTHQCELCTRILKNVINHTRNIQSKDFERLPYPDWTTQWAKDNAIACMKDLVHAARAGKRFCFDSPEVNALNELYEYRAGYNRVRPSRAGTVPGRQQELFDLTGAPVTAP